jgi:hypothetical protein
LFIEAARYAGLTSEREPADGPSAEELKKAQEYTLKEGAVHFLEGGAKHALEEVAKELAEKVPAYKPLYWVGPLAIAKTAYAFASHWFDSVEQGEALKHAHQRDAYHLCWVWAASAALPHDYVARTAHEYRDVARRLGGANKMLTWMQTQPKWGEAKAFAERSAAHGRTEAKRLGVNSAAELIKRLRTDKGFAAHYRCNPAFQHGVRSVIFQAEQAKFYQP